MTPSELEAYFARIGYGGGTSPTLATLRGLVAAHVGAVPFENLDVLLGKGISLDPDAVYDKIVRQRRGGYCFEQNGLFLRVLAALGFDAAPISARVRIQRPRDFLPPRTHMFVRLALEGDVWFADVGVGALSPTAPLRFARDAPQPTPHETRRFVSEGGRWFHQALLGADWADVCEFTGEEMPLVDREVANWFTSAHPASHFRNRLIVARAGERGERLTVLNREFSLRGADGRAVTTPIASPDALLALLEDRFGLVFPPGTRFDCAALDWPA